MKSLLMVAIAMVAAVSVSFSAPAKVCPNHHVTHLPSTSAARTTKTPSTEPPTTKQPTTKTPTTTTEAATTTTVDICKKSATALFYRAYQADVHDHFFTTNADEFQNAIKNLGYKNEGIVGFILTAKAPSSVELYRLYHVEQHDHFYTTSQPERANAISQLGYKDEGIAGYVYQASGAACPCPDLRPLYRVYKGAPEVDHHYTMDAAEKAQAIAGG
ncbi:hypothetical protein AAVH_14980, partial [Aphelenchoides avenae]